MTGPDEKSLQGQEKGKENLQKEWGKGPTRIGDAELDCYILEDGTAVLNKGRMMKALGRPWKGTTRTKDMPNFLGAMNLQPFIRPELKEKLKGIDFYEGTKLISGYHADILPLVCNVYLEARKAGVLLPSQLPTAQICESLIMSFAKVGITALIYEQLGYEKFKHPQALRMLIESYLAEEVRKWSKEFPDELFFQMDRIYGRSIATTSQNRPKYYAKFIRKYIYDPIEKGKVLEELDKRNPTNVKGHRKYRFHSILNTEKGLPTIRSQIWQVIALLKTSANKANFERAFSRLMGHAFQTGLFEQW
jgi:hypothetical protein